MIADAEIERMVEAHRTRNEELTKVLRDKGVDLAVPRTVDCFFWAPSESAAKALVEELVARSHHTVSVNPPEEEDGETYWAVNSSVRCRPSDFMSTETTLDLVSLAIRHDAAFDGWGTSV